MKKTLYKSRKDRFLFGVCGGLAEYFEVDPTLVRILTAALCTTGTGLCYILWQLLSCRSVSSNCLFLESIQRM